MLQSNQYMPSDAKNTVILYHDKCRDGFGSAYAAWKKFGDEASYIPVHDRHKPPQSFNDKIIYIIDFSYPKEVLEEMMQNNKTVVVIDHHISAKEDVTAFPQNVFDNDHSGAVLAWQYFHPQIPVPTLLEYIEDHDLWNFSLSNHRAYMSALDEYPTEFSVWEKLIEDLEDPDFLANYLTKGELLAKFSDDLVEKLLEFKERIYFAGHEVWAINASRIYRSILGNKLAELNEKDNQIALGVVYYHYNGAVHISLRSRGDVDVSKIAKSYGEGGHKNSASFRVKNFSDLPFSFIK